jgi:hypothetical protein
VSASEGLDGARLEAGATSVVTLVKGVAGAREWMTGASAASAYAPINGSTSFDPEISEIATTMPAVVPIAVETTATRTVRMKLGAETR